MYQSQKKHKDDQKEEATPFIGSFSLTKREEKITWAINSIRKKLSQKSHNVRVIEIKDSSKPRAN